MGRQEPPQTFVATVRDGKLTSTLGARSYRRRVVRVTVIGPAGSTADLFIGPPSAGQIATNTVRGDLNTYEASEASPIILPGGMEANVVWNTGTGFASATWYMEAYEDAMG